MLVESDVVLDGSRGLMLHRAREIGVVGLGYVGLPLAVAFAQAGLRVVGIEKDPQKLAALDTYDSYVEDVPAESLQLLVASGKLRFTEDSTALKEAEAVVLCLPTPLNEHREPDLSMLTSGARDVARNLRAGALVALESTTYPGTTREVLLPIIEEELKNDGCLTRGHMSGGYRFLLGFFPRAPRSWQSALHYQQHPQDRGWNNPKNAPNGPRNSTAR